jgi:hypothetical protein
MVILLKHVSKNGGVELCHVFLVGRIMVVGELLMG